MRSAFSPSAHAQAAMRLSGLHAISQTTWPCPGGSDDGEEELDGAMLSLDVDEELPSADVVEEMLPSVDMV